MVPRNDKYHIKAINHRLFLLNGNRSLLAMNLMMETKRRIARRDDGAKNVSLRRRDAKVWKHTNNGFRDYFASWRLCERG